MLQFRDKDGIPATQKTNKCPNLAANVTADSIPSNDKSHTC